MNGGGKGSWFVVLERFGGIKVGEFLALEVWLGLENIKRWGLGRIRG